MIAVADEDDRVAPLGQRDGLEVDLGDERAGRVDDLELARSGLGDDVGSDAMRGEDQPGAVGDLGEFLDEDGALPAKRVDDVAVVDDLVANIDLPAAQLKRALDDLDGAHDAGAEAANLRDHELLDADFRGGGSGHESPI